MMIRLYFFFRKKPIGKRISWSLRSLTLEIDFLGSLRNFRFELIETKKMDLVCRLSFALLPYKTSLGIIAG